MQVWVRVSALRSDQNGRHLADDNFQCISRNENYLKKIFKSNFPEVNPKVMKRAFSPHNLQFLYPGHLFRWRRSTEIWAHMGNYIHNFKWVVHWNGNVVILMKFSSLAALEVVKMTTSSAASDENFVKMTTFSFQCNYSSIPNFGGVLVKPPLKLGYGWVIQSHPFIWMWLLVHAIIIELGWGSLKFCLLISP